MERWSGKFRAAHFFSLRLAYALSPAEQQVPRRASE
jgi:hypothetical protein